LFRHRGVIDGVYSAKGYRYKPHKMSRLKSRSYFITEAICQALERKFGWKKHKMRKSSNEEQRLSSPSSPQNAPLSPEKSLRIASGIGFQDEASSYEKQVSDYCAVPFILSQGNMLHDPKSKTHVYGHPFSEIIHPPQTYHISDSLNIPNTPSRMSGFTFHSQNLPITNFAVPLPHGFQHYPMNLLSMHHNGILPNDANSRLSHIPYLLPHQTQYHTNSQDHRNISTSLPERNLNHHDYQYVHAASLFNSSLQDHFHPIPRNNRLYHQLNNTMQPRQNAQRVPQNLHFDESGVDSRDLYRFSSQKDR
jgi:hypothetical protein